MASTFTNRLGLEKQTDGENPNSWGAILNTNVIDLIDDSIAGYEIVSVSGTGITLTDNNGSSDQSRNASLEFSGTLTANVTITIPSEEKIYFVRENSSGSFAVTMKTAGGSAITLSQNSNIFVACDGTELYTTGVSTISSVTSFTANTLTATSITTSILDVTQIEGGGATFTGNVSATEYYGGGGNLTGIDAALPSGAVFPFAGASAPSGFILCFGQAISRTTYSALFTAIGTTYGTGDGSSTFNLPDLRGRSVAGQDDMGGTSANRLTGLSGGVNGDTLGGTGGAESLTLLNANMPTGVGINTNLILLQSTVDNAANALLTFASYPSYPKVATVISSDTTVFDLSGSGTAANNVQPTIILNYIIKT
jgi:microcystin-dependent protein